MKREHVVLLVVGGIVAAFFAGRAMDRGDSSTQGTSLPGLEAGASSDTDAAADRTTTGVDKTGSASPGSPGSPGSPSSPGSLDTAAKRQVATAEARVAAAKVSRHPSIGADDALVTIVEISDFQCPFCRKGKETLHTLRKNHPNDVRVVFVHLPLAFHKNARPAAIASMAAHRQGRFWEMYSLLFASQRDLGRRAVTAMAAKLGLDMERFKRDLADPALAEQVADDTAIANSLGVGGTPAYFINGVQISGAQPMEKMAAVVKAQIKQADALLQQGTPRNKLHLRMWRRNNPAKADVAIDWIIRGGKPPTSARPKPTQKNKDTPLVKGDPPKKPEHPAKDKTIWKVELRGDEPSRGPADALLTLVLFTDFQCPYCSRVRPALAQVEKTYAGRVRLVFKNQPLSFHKFAPLAAEAGLCAHAQGKFWPMEERLFTHQRELQPEQLRIHGKAVGLNMKTFNQCLTQHQQRAQLNRDVRAAAQLQVTGTPTVFVNGRKIAGAQPFGVFARVIEQEVTRAKKQLASGTSAKALYTTLIATGKALEVRAELGKKSFSFDFTGSPRLGPTSAKATITVFEDLQCPFCARLSSTLAAVRAKLGDRVSVVFKHLPLSNQCNAAMGRDMHPGACHTAFWAMAAEDQQLFWTFTKRIFADMRNLIPAGDDMDARLTALDLNLRAHAKAAGMDVEKAERYVKERSYAPTLERDIREAAQLKVSGTPGVYINGREYNGPLSAARIIAATRRVLADAQRAVKTGTPKK